MFWLLWFLLRNRLSLELLFPIVTISFASLKILNLSSVFKSLADMSRHGFLWIYPAWGFLNFLNVYVCFFANLEAFSAIIFSYTFSAPPSFFSPSTILMTWMLDICYIPNGHWGSVQSSSNLFSLWCSELSIFLLFYLQVHLFFALSFPFCFLVHPLSFLSLFFVCVSYCPFRF